MFRIAMFRGIIVKYKPVTSIGDNGKKVQGLIKLIASNKNYSVWLQSLIRFQKVH